MDSGGNAGVQASLAVAPVTPRLLDLHSTASYLSLSEWTVRELEHNGVLPRVRIPISNERELRKLLFDKMDLDRFLEAWKERRANA